MVVLSEIITPTAGVRLQQQNTVAFVGENELGNGCLYITESCVAWLNDAGCGLTLNYPSISLHAISRDVAAFHKPCLYVMFDGKLEESSSENDADDDNEPEVDPETDITEIRFVPNDATALDNMYGTLSDCQILHPDPDDSFSDDDDYEAPNPGGHEITVEGVDGDVDDEGSDTDDHHVGVAHNNGDAMDTENGGDNGQFDDVDE